MTDFKKPETRQGWDTPDNLAPDQRARVDELMSKIKSGSSGLNHHWGRASKPDEGAPRNTTSENFNYTANDQGITVNGRHYASLEEVPAEERSRIEAFQREFGPDSELMKNMLADGKSVNRRSSSWVWSTKKGSKTTTRTRHTTTSDEDALAPSARVHQPGEVPTGFTTSVPHADVSPGAVPRTSGMRRLSQFVVLVIVVAAVWLGGQALGLF